MSLLWSCSASVKLIWPALRSCSHIVQEKKNPLCRGKCLGRKVLMLAMFFSFKKISNI